MLFFWTFEHIHKRILKKYIFNQFPQKYEAASCDTEDWGNNAEYSALITEINNILKYIKTENSYFKL